MTEILDPRIRPGDRFRGCFLGGRRHFRWHVDRVTHKHTQAQVDGRRVNLKHWRDDDPRWNRVHFVDTPLDPILIVATRYRELSGPDEILLYGNQRVFTADRNADAPDDCTRVEGPRDCRRFTKQENDLVVPL